ncbi:Concanavalin A-like lectin/glucanase, subgroup [Ascosphaera apis ARSEF 7405]|uniref:Concanavalin A-like lectin/glucanase, subgroup n=1 Tax=Ascosphaera apis ARSEF 7405 TaxID=392613 RepID=A0A168DTW9_9EURO|nr:Concanavalin A-like lectin/glucanase, subgroup [Ascosphaera apis ARSEF 7405]
MARKTTLLLAILSLFSAAVEASCECGFLMNGTNDYFTHILYNNFTFYRSTKVASLSPAFSRDWDVQRWAREPKNWATPLPIVNKEDNIFIRDGHLMLKQDAYSLNDVLFGKNVSVASMVSKRNDFFHGSFRIDLALVGATGGSVVGFFWYKV